jgi:hypothetical protein
MHSMTSITVKTDRRHFLAVSAGAVAACAGLAVIAPPADPVFAAIDAHRAAVTALEAIHTATVEEALIASNGAPLPIQIAPSGLQAAFSATLAPAAALMGTVPTTHAGLRALESHLRADSMLRRRIGHTVTVDGLTFSSHDGSPTAVDWHIAKKNAAEIDQAA